MNKIYAMMRYRIYQSLKKNKTPIECMSDEELAQVVSSLNTDEIRKSVFELFEIQYALTPEIILRTSALTVAEKDEHVIVYIECI